MNCSSRGITTSMKTRATAFVAAVLLCAPPVAANGATWFVTESGTDDASCGLDASTACRSITQAIALAAPGDTISVGPGRYGDLNLSGTLGDMPGEETGSPGCSCVLSMNKHVIILSRGGAATTLIDGTGTDALQTVLVLSDGGEFGRPGKGFTVTEPARFDPVLKKFTGHGIRIDGSNVMIRGNQVVFTNSILATTTGSGIVTANAAPILIEGNRVLNWRIGIEVRDSGAATVSGNEVIGNQVGIYASGGHIVRNVATGNLYGFQLRGDVTVINNTASKNSGGFAFWVLTDFSGTLTRNNMISNGRSGFQGCGIFNQDVVGLKAPNNYWGSAGGPGASSAEFNCDSTMVPGSGTTETAPFATKPFKVKIVKP